MCASRIVGAQVPAVAFLLCLASLLPFGYGWRDDSHDVGSMSTAQAVGVLPHGQLHKLKRDAMRNGGSSVIQESPVEMQIASSQDMGARAPLPVQEAQPVANEGSAPLGEAIADVDLDSAKAHMTSADSLVRHSQEQAPSGGADMVVVDSSEGAPVGNAEAAVELGDDIGVKAHQAAEQVKQVVEPGQHRSDCSDGKCGGHDGSPDSSHTGKKSVMVPTVSNTLPKCTPACKWNCTQPECEQVCKPRCNAPTCQTRCAEPDFNGCHLECTTPTCMILCPRKPHLPANCEMHCTEPRCKFKCDDRQQPCKTYCQQPQCTWDCKKPEACPEPKCDMECAKDGECGDAMVRTELPPLKPGETAVEQFEAPVHMKEGTVSQTTPSPANEMHVNITQANETGVQRRKVSVPVNNTIMKREIAKCECEGYEKGATPGETMCAYGKNCARKKDHGDTCRGNGIECVMPEAESKETTNVASSSSTVSSSGSPNEPSTVATTTTAAAPTSAKALAAEGNTGKIGVGGVLGTDGTGEKTVSYGNAACPCIGLDGLKGIITVEEARSAGNHVSMKYPAMLGAHCDDWDNGNLAGKCDVGGTPGKDNGECTKQWCYVDPCNCNLPELPEESQFQSLRYHGVALFYSHATCDPKRVEVLNASKSCGGQDTKEKCEALEPEGKSEKCNWKGDTNRCVPRELDAFCSDEADESVYGNKTCRCIGLDNGHDKVTDENYALFSINNNTVKYPANVGSKCEAWDHSVHPDCINLTKHHQKLPEWCTNKWCYINPCECGVDVPPNRDFYGTSTFRGVPIYYSYAACGDSDQKPQDDEVADAKDCTMVGQFCLDDDVAAKCQGEKHNELPARNAESGSVALVLTVPLLTALLQIAGLAPELRM